MQAGSETGPFIRLRMPGSPLSAQHTRAGPALRAGPRAAGFTEVGRGTSPHSSGTVSDASETTRNTM